MLTAEANHSLLQKRIPQSKNKSAMAKVNYRHDRQFIESSGDSLAFLALPEHKTYVETVINKNLLKEAFCPKGGSI